MDQAPPEIWAGWWCVSWGSQACHYSTGSWPREFPLVWPQACLWKRFKKGRRSNLVQRSCDGFICSLWGDQTLPGLFELVLKLARALWLASWNVLTLASLVGLGFSVCVSLSHTVSRILASGRGPRMAGGVLESFQSVGMKKSLRSSGPIDL